VSTLAKFKEVSDLVEALPESEQNLAYEFIKRLVLAWDPDFTKLTPVERKRLEDVRADYEQGNFVSHEDVNWD